MEIPARKGDFHRFLLLKTDIQMLGLGPPACPARALVNRGHNWKLQHEGAIVVVFTFEKLTSRFWRNKLDAGTPKS